MSPIRVAFSLIHGRRKRMLPIIRAKNISNANRRLTRALNKLAIENVTIQKTIYSFSVTSLIGRGCMEWSRSRTIQMLVGTDLSVLIYKDKPLARA